jgi:signal transduction histidine kinase
MELDANTREQSRAQLAALAQHLGDRQDHLLQNWRTATENVPELTVAPSLTRLQFNDHIPGVLDALAQKLRAWPEAETAEAKQQEKEQVTGHGLQRWQQGYQLRELTREWGQLQMCLMEELESYSGSHPELEPLVMPAARRALAQLCWDGISDSTTQYWRLNQAEAAGHVRDLQRALSTLNELEQVRAAGWREAAHDLRGSVLVVSGAASLLREDTSDFLRQQIFEMLRNGVASLHEMLNDLVSLARLEAGQEQRNVTRFDAAALISSFCDNSRALAQEKGLYLKPNGPDLLMVDGDRAKIGRILQNLLLNALKYTQRGGVTVLWGAAQGHGNGSWMFCVQDTGPGLDAGPSAPLARQLYDATQISHEVDEVDLPNMAAVQAASAPTLEAQSATLPAYQLPGEGVGLSIVKRLCELLDASLELETSPGQGSTFRVVLPCNYHKDAWLPPKPGTEEGWNADSRQAKS